jgi:hypothetical protein
MAQPAAGQSAFELLNDFLLADHIIEYLGTVFAG